MQYYYRGQGKIQKGTGQSSIGDVVKFDFTTSPKEEKMKIILAAVNAKYIHSNLAVYSLRAYARRYSRDIMIKEYTINQQPDSILMDLYTEAPDVICFSCYLWNILYVEQIMTELPKILPKARIWLGGPEVSYDAPEMLRRYPMVEGIMCGEGEETFLELAEYFHEEAGKSLKNIRGIAYRDDEGSIQVNESRPVLDLSTVPFIYGREYNDMETFRNRIIYYESSRGCPFSCSYCLSSIDKCLRFRDIDLVREELQFFLDHRVPQVKFVDRTFNCRHDHAMAVWSYLAEHDNGITNFHFEVSADLLNDAEITLIQTMRPGLIQLEIGVQSANDRTIREIRRTMNLDEVRRKTALIREAGNVHQHLDLIAGLPWEDYESFARSFDVVYAMKPDQLQLGFLKVLKGSMMYEKAEEYGLQYQSRPPYEVLSTKWLPYRDVIRLKKVEEMVEVYYNSGQFRHTLEHLETAEKKNGAGRCFPTAFSLFEALAAFYDSRGLNGISHSRIARYEILYEFIQESDVCGGDGWREWLALDIYLRENVKNRPEFLGESKVLKEEAAEFYRREEEERRFLKEYEGYDYRQMRKMTHLERIEDKLLLFDYRNRNPLNGDAMVYEVQR